MALRYRFDDIEVDVQSFRLLKAGSPVALEPKALNLLIFLVENRGRLVGRRELIDAVWNGAFVTDHVLNRAMGQLRRQLGDDPKQPRYVETVPTLGYRFIARVEQEQQDTLVESSGQLEATASTPLQDRQRVDEPIPVPHTRSLQTPVPTRPRRRTGVAVGIALVLILSVVTFWMVRRRSHSANARPIQSLAVLPLDNLSGDASQQYLADGMTDELITSLGRIGALRVISQTTAMEYKGAHKPLPQIARELNVDAIVEGSVLRSGDKIRIAAQLVAAPAEKQLWAQTYEGGMDDVLGLQNRVASAVAEQIRIKLTPMERTQLADTQNVNPAAYEALLKGNYFFRQNSPESTRKSLEYFQQAVKLDPGFARAYVGIARSYNLLGEGDVPVGEATAAADSATAKALQLQPDLDEAYAERGWTLLFYHWDFPGAERDFRHALELNPGSEDAFEGLGDYLVVMGQFDKGLQQLKKARDLDPLSPFLVTDYCIMLSYARRYGEAQAQCLASLELDPNFKWGLWNTADVFLDQGKIAEAKSLAVRAGECDEACMAMMEEIHGVPGKSGAFDSWLKMQKVKPDPFFLASAYAGLGRKDEALAALEKAYEQRSEPHAMTFLSVDHHFDSLRRDPRFDAFLRYAGLPPQPHTQFAQPDRSIKH
ncbi:MAG: winged helix-turn-helix domain-containing protein [Acidobacteriaceae bacterium]|jgi:TolB-like protein/DNA-binding winged helix-turn-helix (wHTH) protein/Flp pilus assembly protein TadD